MCSSPDPANAYRILGGRPHFGRRSPHDGRTEEIRRLRGPAQAGAVALGREGLSVRQIRDCTKVINSDILHRLLKGEPPPEWTKRPNTKDGLRARARELRLEGETYDQIQVEPGCSKSSISPWVRDLPKPEPRYTDTERLALMRAGLADLRKPYSRRENLLFINSDPHVIKAYLKRLGPLGEHRRRPSRLPRQLRDEERRTLSSRRRRLVRHSVGCRSGNLTQCPVRPGLFPHGVIRQHCGFWYRMFRFES